MVEHWRPFDAELTNAEGLRGPALYRRVVEQFRAETNPRYAPGLDTTWCNIFVWDVTRAMGCEVPHWVESDGAPAPPGVGHELTANGVATWLRECGESFGWREVPAAEAEMQAGLGHPTVAAWRNQYGHGHVAVVLPSQAGLRIAQAGKRCFFDEPLANGFGALTPAFFSHP